MLSALVLNWKQVIWNGWVEKEKNIKIDKI